MNEITYQLCQVDFKFETSIQYKPSYSQQHILKSNSSDHREWNYFFSVDTLIGSIKNC